MRILILGSNGMIGHKLYQIFSKQYIDTWAIFRLTFDSDRLSDFFDKSKIIDNCDLLDLENLSKVLDNLKPDFILNASGITIRRGVSDVYWKSILINSVIPNFLNDWVLKNDKRLIHFSTDCVFSGEKGFYDEEDFCDSDNIYGKSKALGEIFNSPNSLTLRSSMIGRELFNNTELLEWFLMNKNKSINGFDKVYYSGITTVRMANYVLQIVKQFPRMSGIYNVSSIEISKYDLLIKLNNYFENNTQINKDSSYYSNKVLNSQKFYSYTGFKQPNWEELIIELVDDCKNNYKYYKN